MPKKQTKAKKTIVSVKKVAKPVKKAAVAKSKGTYIEILNMDGKVVGREKLVEKFFAAKQNQKLVAQAVRVYLANQAKNTASTKTRGEVAGSTRKIRRQKGTGMARQGSARAPHRVGGGVVFGPRPGKTFLKLPKKARALALASVLTTKFNQGNIMAVDGMEKLEPKTKNLNLVLTKLPAAGKKLLVINPDSKNIKLAARNLKDCDYAMAESLNIYQAYVADKIIFTKTALVKFNKD